MSKQPPRILPVIHHIDSRTTHAEVNQALRLGVDGVFLISHFAGDPAYAGIADDETLMCLAKELKSLHPGACIGINCLSWSPLYSAGRAVEARLDMIWADSMGVDSRGLTGEGEALKSLASAHPRTQFFASVAFKYMPEEPAPVTAADNARRAGFVPTTSGSATGAPPDVGKIRAMAGSGPLAVASGMNPDNVHLYTPYLSDILVATGISADDHHLDPDKLASFIKSVR